MAKKYSTINFGLVTIPVTISTAVVDNDISFHQYHKKCLERVMYQKYCSHCKKVLKDTDIIKGYDSDGEQIVFFDRKELNALKPENDGDIEIVSFIPIKEIDAKYFQKTYFVLPAHKSKAYYLLEQVLEKSKLVALCKLVIHNKFYYAIIRTSHDIFLLTTLFFESEMKEEPEVKSPKLTNKEMELANELVLKMKGHFEPQKYKDEYQVKLSKAIKNKMHGKKVSREKTKKKIEVASLMEALEKSLKK